MDKLKKYRAIIEQYLDNRAKGTLATHPGAKPHLIIDRDHDEYVFMWVGWSGYDYKHGIMFHHQIINSIVWVHDDRTE